MSGRGERPEEADGEEQPEKEAESVALGEEVYNKDWELLGRVRGYEAGGFFVTTRDGMERLGIEHARSGHGFGEAHLMWRRMNCGEMSELDEGFPERCPTAASKRRRSCDGRKTERTPPGAIETGVQS